MPNIKIVNNPFGEKGAAWEDPYGRVGVRIDGEDSVKWYNMITDSGRSYLIDELTMIVNKPFNSKDQTCHYSIEQLFGTTIVRESLNS